MVGYAVSSLFDAEAEAVLHGVNAEGKFGAGLAKAMAEAWPGSKDSYLKAFREGLIVPGRVAWADLGAGPVVGHMVTQPTYGRRGVHVDYAAVDRCLEEVARASREGVPGTRLAGGFSSVALPKFGAGLGGGDWRRIEEMVEARLAGLDVRVHVTHPDEIPEWRRAPSP